MGNDLIFGIVYLVDYGNELHDSITMNIAVLQMDFKMLVMDALIFVVVN
jgi:hypothetical protein